VQPPAEIVLTGGAFNRVVRIGDTVRRSKTGPWTPNIHALLRHLEQTGFEGAPRALGMDEDGREILSFVPGTALRDLLPDTGDGGRSDELVLASARLLRRYHDASSGFVGMADAVWQHSWFTAETAHSIDVVASLADEVICHNDISPANTIVVNGVPAAFIDWDFAHPAPRAWDVAYAMASFGPYLSNKPSAAPAERGRLMRLFCDGYGLTEPDERCGLLDVAEVQQRSLLETLRTRAAAGDPWCVKAWEKTEGGRPMRENIEYLRDNRAVLAMALGGG
jgi:hypothetical protein